MRKKLVDDTKLHIKKMLQESGHIPDQESCAPLEDKEAIQYMDLEISGDEKSEVEDDDREPDEADPVVVFKEENVVGVLEERYAVKILEEVVEILEKPVEAQEDGHNQAA